MGSGKEAGKDEDMGAARRKERGNCWGRGIQRKVRCPKYVSVVSSLCQTGPSLEASTVPFSQGEAVRGSEGRKAKIRQIKFGWLVAGRTRRNQE